MKLKETKDDVAIFSSENIPTTKILQVGSIVISTQRLRRTRKIFFIYSFFYTSTRHIANCAHYVNSDPITAFQKLMRAF